MVHHSLKYNSEDNLLEDKKLWIAVRFIILGNEEVLRLFTWVFIDLMISGFELETSRFELVTHGSELVNHGFEHVTRGFEQALLNFQLVL